MKVENMAMNQFIIYLDNCIAFQSYSTLIAVRKDRIMYYGPSWDYSKTTLKYFKLFMRTSLTKVGLLCLFETSDCYQLVSEEDLMDMIKCQKKL
jgi:hypothetical protein